MKNGEGWQTSNWLQCAISLSEITQPKRGCMRPQLDCQETIRGSLKSGSALCWLVCRIACPVRTGNIQHGRGRPRPYTPTTRLCPATSTLRLTVIFDVPP